MLKSAFSLIRTYKYFALAIIFLLGGFSSCSTQQASQKETISTNTDSKDYLEARKQLESISRLLGEISNLLDDNKKLSSLNKDFIREIRSASENSSLGNRDLTEVKNLLENISKQLGAIGLEENKKSGNISSLIELNNKMREFYEERIRFLELISNENLKKNKDECCELHISAADLIDKTLAANNDGRNYSVSLFSLILTFIAMAGGIVWYILRESFEKEKTEFIKRFEIEKDKLRDETHNYALYRSVLVRVGLGLNMFNFYYDGLKRLIALDRAAFSPVGITLVEELDLNNVPLKYKNDLHQFIGHLRQATAICKEATTELKEVKADALPEARRIGLENLKPIHYCNLTYYAAEMYRQAEATEEKKEFRVKTREYLREAVNIVSEDEKSRGKKSNQWHHYQDSILYARYLLDFEKLKSDVQKGAAFKAGVDAIMVFAEELGDDKSARFFKEKWDKLLNNL